MSLIPRWKFERHVRRDSASDDEDRGSDVNVNYVADSGDAGELEVYHDVETDLGDEDVGVTLNMYDSDLNLIIHKDTYTCAIPLTSKPLHHLRAGVRATYGFTTGRICYEVKLEFCKLPGNNDEQSPYELRVGWSSAASSLQLGEDFHSFGFANVGVVWSNNESKSYGSPIHSGDVIGALLDMESDPAIMSFTVNGIPVGIAFKVPFSDLRGVALYPHVLTRNVLFECKFEGKFPWFRPPNGYVYAGDTFLQERVMGPLQPETEAREVILVCGLPRCGKTTWIKNFCTESSHKYHVLSCRNQIDVKKSENEMDWGFLRKCEMKLRKLASECNRRFIFEEDTLSHTAQRQMMTYFKDFERQAVIIIPSDKEYDRRFREAKHQKSWGDFYVEYMKSKFVLPAMGVFDVIVYPELPEDQARMSITRYNEEGDRYASCRTKPSKSRGKDKNSCTISLQRGGTYNVDLSSSSDDSMSDIEEEISAINAFRILQNREKRLNAQKEIKSSDPEMSGALGSASINCGSKNTEKTSDGDPPKDGQENPNLNDCADYLNIGRGDRCPITNTQIAVYNFSECKVGLTQEGLASSHSHSVGQDNQLNKTLSSQMFKFTNYRKFNRNIGPSRNYRGSRISTSNFASRHNGMPPQYNEMRSQYRSRDYKEQNFRPYRPLFNRQYRWCHKDYEPVYSRTTGNYGRMRHTYHNSRDEMQEGMRDGMQEAMKEHFTTNHNGYGAQGRYRSNSTPNNGYYWSNC